MFLARPPSARSAPAEEAGGAEASGRVVLEVRACPDAPADSVRRIVGIEIGDLLVGVGEPVPAASDRLTIRCAGGLAWVEAAGDARAKPVDRTLRLDDFPGDAAPRALALAGIEVLAALSPAVRKRLAARQNVTPSPAQERPRLRETAQAAFQGEPSTQIGAAALWRTFLVAGGMSAWGGRVEVESRIARWWNLGFDIEAAGSRGHSRLGEASGLLLSGGAFVGARMGGARLGGAFVLGGRMGLTRMAGDTGGDVAVAAERVTRPWGGPAACLRAHGGLGPTELTLTAEVGRSLFAAEGLADSSTVLAASGSWVAVSLGVAYRIEHGRSR
jgi:hypothetical protein